MSLGGGDMRRFGAERIIPVPRTTRLQGTTRRGGPRWPTEMVSVRDLSGLLPLVPEQFELLVACNTKKRRQSGHIMPGMGMGI